MNPAPLVAAAALLVALGIAHSTLGERYILVRLFRHELPRLFGSDWFTRRTLRFAWHLTSVAWIGLAVALVQLGGVDPLASRRWALLAIAGTFLVSGVVAAAASKGRHLSWIAFLAVAALVGWAAVAG